MRNYDDEMVTPLGMVEAYASEMGLIASEQEMSDVFDNAMLAEIIKTHGEDDRVAASEAFSDWADRMCRDGDIHPEQYDKYDYVGEMS